MKIQIIALGMTDQSHRKFYNTQDMGLGRALADMGHCVDMYSFIKGDTDETVEFAENLLYALSSLKIIRVSFTAFL